MHSITTSHLVLPKLATARQSRIFTPADSICLSLTVAVLPGCRCRLDKDNKPGKFYDTGEDQHGVVAKRYGEQQQLYQQL